MKPQPPEYPRNVPDIDLGEDLLLPGAIIYTQDEDEAGDAEELARIRASKRRRIEANAQAYLRGEGLFILSAGLRGPFDVGWNNPWAEKNKRKHQTMADADAAPEDTAVSRAQKMLRKDHLGSQTPWKSSRNRQPVPVNPFERARSEHTGHCQPSPEQKVENWLRRNSALPQQQMFVEPTSPTPKKHLVPTPRPQSSGQRWTPTKQVITVSSQDVKAPIHHLDQRVAESFDTIVPGAGHGVESGGAHSRLQSALKAASPDAARTGPHISGRMEKVENTEKSTRAEAAIIRMKRRFVDPGSMTAGTSQAQKQASEMGIAAGGALKKTIREPDSKADGIDKPQNCFPRNTVGEARSDDLWEPAMATSEVNLGELEAPIDDQLRQERHEEHSKTQTNAGEEQNQERHLMPPLSTAVSEVHSTNLPPSAQPRPELQNSTSNVSSGALLAKVAEPTEPAVAPSGSGAHQHSHAGPEPTSKSDLADPTGMHKLTSAIDEAPCASTTPRPTHQAIDVSLVTSPKARKQADQAEKDRAPTKTSSLARMAKASSKRGSTSFDVEPFSLSSNGSIKSVLKIQKAGHAPKPALRKATPPPFFDQPEMDMDTSIEHLENSPPCPDSHLHSPPNTKKRPARSILKSTNTLSSAPRAVAAATLCSNPISKLLESPGSSHDMLVSGQNGVAHGDNDGFDLDGAIDDMGSFLSTWEDEKGGVRAS